MKYDHIIDLELFIDALLFFCLILNLVTELSNIRKKYGGNKAAVITSRNYFRAFLLDSRKLKCIRTVVSGRRNRFSCYWHTIRDMVRVRVHFCSLRFRISTSQMTF